MKTLGIIFLSSVLVFAAAAGNLWAAAPSQNLEIAVNWTDNSNNETGFRVYRKIGAGSYAPLADKGANVTTHIDNVTGDPGATAYCYRVSAFNAAGESPQGPEGCGTSPAIIVVPVSPGGATIIIKVQ